MNWVPSVFLSPIDCGFWVLLCLKPKPWGFEIPKRALQRLELYDVGKTKRQKSESGFAFLGICLLKAKALGIEI